MDLIPFYARLVATLHPCLDDIAPLLVDTLVRDLRFQVRKKDQVHVHSKLKNVRFIGECVHVCVCVCVSVFSPGFTGQRAQVIIHDHAPILRTPRAPLRIYATPLNSCFACCAIRRTLAARVLLSIMPPKAKKPKLVAGQKTLSFAQGSEPSTALPLESAVSSLSTVSRGWDVLGTPSSRRGAIASWRALLLLYKLSAVHT